MTDGPIGFQPGPLDAKTWHPPSSEELRLVRHLRWLTSPERGTAGMPARLSLWMLVAPMTQLAFFNFDLQAFLFLVFHRTLVAIVGHAVFMTSENLFVMATLRGHTFVQTPVGALDAGLVYLSLLAVWYGVVAWRARLRAWFVVTLPVLGLLYVGLGERAARAGLCRHGGRNLPRAT